MRFKQRHPTHTRVRAALMPDSTTVQYAYDANGNRIQRWVNAAGPVSTPPAAGVDQFAYDRENRLVSSVIAAPDSAEVPRSAGHYAFAYDARTRRVRRSQAGKPGVILSFAGGLSVQEYFTKESGRPAPTSNSSSSDSDSISSLGSSSDSSSDSSSNSDPDTLPGPDVEYIRGSDYGGGIGGILYSIRKVTVDGQSVRVASLDHYNARGDVIAKSTADPTADVTWMAAYLAFGTRPQEKGTNPDPHRANTKEEDGTGLLNEGHRYRCLETGMFITRDPAGFIDGPNLYAYVKQNPWSAFDPHGLDEVPLAKPAQENAPETKIYSSYSEGRAQMATTTLGQKMNSVMANAHQRVTWRMDTESEGPANTGKGATGPVITLTRSSKADTVVHEAGHAVEQIANAKPAGALTASQEGAVKSAKEVLAMVTDERDTQIKDSNGFPQPGASVELRAQRIRNIVQTEALLNKITDPAERERVLTTVKAALSSDSLAGTKYKNLNLGPAEHEIMQKMQHGYAQNNSYLKLPAGSQLGKYPATEPAKVPQAKEKEGK